MKKLLLISSCALLFFGSCKQSTKSTAVGADSIAIKTINDASLTQYLSVIAADSLEGRKPFTNGETKTINYLKTQFEKLGLQPGNGNSFFQEVPMVEIKSVPEDKMVLKGKAASLTLNYLTDFVAGTRRVQDDVSISNSPLVFAGYGIVAPEYGWNDYTNLDVKGKTVVVLINDPGFADSTLFKGKNMTYYGDGSINLKKLPVRELRGLLLFMIPNQRLTHGQLFEAVGRNLNSPCKVKIME